VDRRRAADLLARQSSGGRPNGGGRGRAADRTESRLDAAVDLVAHEHLSTEEAAFVEAGRQLRAREHGEARRRTRRLRILAGVTSVLAAVAIGIGVIAVVQRNDARQAQATADQAARSAQIEALVGRADSLRNSQRDTAALLAVEAFRLADTARSRSTLLATFTGAAGFLESAVSTVSTSAAPSSCPAATPLTSTWKTGASDPTTSIPVHSARSFRAGAALGRRRRASLSRR
jgi:hypothetical protein